jgi:hypothetical protein
MARRGDAQALHHPNRDAVSALDAAAQEAWL